MYADILKPENSGENKSELYGQRVLVPLLFRGKEIVVGEFTLLTDCNYNPSLEILQICGKYAIKTLRKCSESENHFLYNKSYINDIKNVIMTIGYEKHHF